jgi:hypothetical protein
MNRAVYNTLRQLSRMHPKAIFEHPKKIVPLAIEITDELVTRHGQQLGEQNIRNAITKYENFRHYIKSVAASLPRRDLAGAEVAQISTSEQSEASNRMASKTLRDCCNQVRDIGLSDAERSQIETALENDYFELTFLSAGVNRELDHRLAFELRQDLRLVAESLAMSKPLIISQFDLESARYVEATSGCTMMLLAENFPAARNFVKAAAKSAKVLQASNHKFFPNHFFDETDIASHDVYLNAVETFKEGQFDEAAEHFEKWLSLNAKRRGQGNTQYDTIVFLHQLCLALDSVKRSSATKEIWDGLDNLLSSSSLTVFKTARALWTHLAPLKSLSLHEQKQIPGASEVVEALLRQARGEWRLLSIFMRLSNDADVGAGLAESVKLPEFLDVFHCIPEIGGHWQYLIMQNLINSLILKADYETRLHSIITGETKITDETSLMSFQIERLTDSELVRYNRKLIASRGNDKDLEVWDRRIPEWWQARKEASSGDPAAVSTGMGFLSGLRAFPHVLHVTSSEALPTRSRGRSSGRIRRISAKRLWRFSPAEFVLSGEISIDAGRYAYMRPRWNRRLDSSYQLRDPDDRVVQSRVPEWMVLFERWASGSGEASAAGFLQWCNQIEPRWRVVALRLLSRMTFFSEAMILDAWRSLYRTTIPADLKTSRNAYVGLGPASKSGHHQLYPLRQALGELKENERGFRPATAFAAIESLSEQSNIDSVVFVDDLVGTGEQAARFMRELVSKHTWLRKRRLYICCLVGFEQGLSRLGELLGEFSGRAFAFKKMTDADRAFSPGNAHWDSDSDREEAREWCRCLGKALWSERGSDGEESALGWKGSEALVAFHYNTPNNTLPLFWADGVVNGEKWHPLLQRFPG